MLVMMPVFKIIAVLSLTACLTTCATMKRPGSDPARMSADTLCYRVAYGRGDQVLRDEIAARNLDCRAILAQQQAFNDRSSGGGLW